MPEKVKITCTLGAPSRFPRLGAAAFGSISSLVRAKRDPHDVGRRFGHNGEPGLCLIRCRQLPVVAKDHLGRVSRFQCHAVYVMDLSKAIADQGMP